MVFKITLDIRGEHLHPEKLLPGLSGELVMTGTFPEKGKNGCHCSRVMHMMHPEKICHAGDEVKSYKSAVIRFLEKNHLVIAENGGSDICVSCEIYFTGDNFNIGLFNRNQLKIISDCNASVSFSAYQMSEEKISEIFGEE